MSLIAMTLLALGLGIGQMLMLRRLTERLCARPGS